MKSSRCLKWLILNRGINVNHQNLVTCSRRVNRHIILDVVDKDSWINFLMMSSLQACNCKLFHFWTSFSVPICWLINGSHNFHSLAQPLNVITDDDNSVSKIAAPRFPLCFSCQQNRELCLCACLDPSVYECDYNGWWWFDGFIVVVAADFSGLKCFLKRCRARERSNFATDTKIVFNFGTIKSVFLVASQNLFQT